jgi:1-acyl-sn-glycerol-3-phosphate acyltransferase
VLVANHASHLDAIALLCALPLRRVNSAYPLAARDYFSASRLRLVLTTLIANLMLIDRDAKALDELKRYQEMLKLGETVLVMFPEGTRSQDGQVARFRRGIGSLLAGTVIPVVPCFLDGTMKALPKGEWIIRPAPIRLVIGAPRTYEQVEPTDAGILQICAELRDAVLALAPETCPHRAQPDSQEAFS